MVDERLRDHPGVRRFAEGVVGHLSSVGRRAASPERVLTKAVDLLLLAIAEDEMPAARMLADHPVILASFFQNADLLESGTPESVRVARAIMRALEIVDDRSNTG